MHYKTIILKLKTHRQKTSIERKKHQTPAQHHLKHYTTPQLKHLTTIKLNSTNPLDDKPLPPRDHENHHNHETTTMPSKQHPPPQACCMCNSW